MKRALALLFVLSFMMGAATSTRVREEVPILKISVESLKDVERGNCAEASVSVEQGAMPKGAEEVLRMSLVGETSLALSIFEDGFKDRAAQYCLEHVHVLRAVAAEGATGYLEAEAVAWRWPQ